MKKKKNKNNLSPSQQLFYDAIDWDAFHKALNDPKSAKEIKDILNKMRY